MPRCTATTTTSSGVGHSTDGMRCLSECRWRRSKVGSLCPSECAGTQARVSATGHLPRCRSARGRGTFSRPACREMTTMSWVRASSPPRPGPARGRRPSLWLPTTMMSWSDAAWTRARASGSSMFLGDVDSGLCAEVGSSNVVRCSASSQSWFSRRYGRTHGESRRRRARSMAVAGRREWNAYSQRRARVVRLVGADDSYSAVDTVARGGWGTTNGHEAWRTTADSDGTEQQAGVPWPRPWIRGRRRVAALVGLSSAVRASAW